MNISKKQAQKIGNAMKVNWDKVDLEQFRRGIEVEFEHGTEYPNTDITKDDLVMTAKIALAHLRELPDYYTKLDKMENLKEAIGDASVFKKIIQFFKANPNPSDEMVHGLAKKLGIDKHKFEEEIYSLLTDLVKTKTIKEDGFAEPPNTTALGISLEMVETIAQKVGIDFSKYQIEDLRYGIIEELGLMEINVMTNASNETIGKATYRAHQNLSQDPAYYTKDMGDLEQQHLDPSIAKDNYELNKMVESIVKQELRKHK
jgi:hypothetical protein